MLSFKCARPSFTAGMTLGDVFRMLLLYSVNKVWVSLLSSLPSSHVLVTSSTGSPSIITAWRRASMAEQVAATGPLLCRHVPSSLVSPAVPACSQCSSALCPPSCPRAAGGSAPCCPSSGPGLQPSSLQLVQGHQGRRLCPWGRGDVGPHTVRGPRHCPAVGKSSENSTPSSHVVENKAAIL